MVAGCTGTTLSPRRASTGGFLLRFSGLSQGGNPAAIVAATNVKLVRKAQADDCMEVDGDEQRRSSDIGRLGCVSRTCPTRFPTYRVISSTNTAYYWRTGQCGMGWLDFSSTTCSVCIVAISLN